MNSDHAAVITKGAVHGTQLCLHLQLWLPPSVANQYQPPCALMWVRHVGSITAYTTCYIYLIQVLMSAVYLHNPPLCSHQLVLLYLQNCQTTQVLHVKWWFKSSTSRRRSCCFAICPPSLLSLSALGFFSDYSWHKQIHNGYQAVLIHFHKKSEKK